MTALVHQLFRFISRVFAKNKLSILIYHQVFEQPNAMRPSEPTAELFDWQMRLVSRFFTPMSLTDAIKAIEENRLPANAICVTFDDGYKNNLEVAQPILSKYGIPATVYIATKFSSGENMFNDRVLDLIGDTNRQEFDLSAVDMSKQLTSDFNDRVRLAHQVINKVKYLRYEERQQVIDKIYQDNDAQAYPSRMMTKEQIKALAATNIGIGAHTVDHPILRTLSEQEQVRQLKESKDTLEQWLGKPVIDFAYPNGKLGDDYSEKTVDIVKQVGFENAVSTHWGVSSKITNKFQLKRFTPWDNSPVKFHFRLLLNQLGFLK